MARDETTSKATPAKSGIELPAPTSAPFVCAFGVTLIFAGIVTNWSVSIIGFILGLVGAIRWWHEVLPDNQEECIPFQDERPVIEPRPGGIAHLMTEGSTHRARIPTEIHPYGAGFRGGIFGGLVMAAIAVAYGFIYHGSAWYALNILAATMLPSLGQDDPAQLAQWHLGGFIVGFCIHACMSMMIGLCYGVILPMIPRFRFLFGVVGIPLLWTGLSWATLSVINPVLNEDINWLWFIGSQLGFGITCWFIVSRSERIGTMQNWSMLERAGMDAPGVPGIGGDKE